MKRYNYATPSPQENEEITELPSRSSVHKTDRTIFTRWFYRVLAMSFIVLTVGLLLWGFLALNE